MKRASLFYGQNGTRLGTIPLRSEGTRLKIQRAQKPAGRMGIGLDLVAVKRTWLWEELAFLALWLCGVLGVGYGLKAVLSFP